jgi:hypothetical protein
MVRGMGSLVHPARSALVAVTAAALAIMAAAPAGAAAGKGSCEAFGSQGSAQSYFLKQGGSRTHRVGRLDPDRDGVACEGLGGPFRGYATIGYNRRRDFIYGGATMPPDPAGGYACMRGDTHFPESARRLHLYRVKPGPDAALLGEYGITAEARQDSGRLVWKLNRPLPSPGRYYVVFEERIPLTPYGPVLCPSFRSAVTYLGG